MKHLCFLLTGCLRYSETLTEYSYFHGKTWGLLATGNNWKHWLYYKASAGMSYSGMVCLDSGMTRQFQGTEVDFIGASAYKALLGKLPQFSAWPPGLPALEVTTEGHFLAGPGNRGHLGGLRK